MTDPLENPRVRLGRRVLVVDDDRDLADTLAHLLVLEGYDVEIASSTSAAQRALECFAANIALIDIRMGEQSGLGFLSEIRRTHPSLTCVMMTAYASVETTISALRKGAYDYLCKPFHTDDLLATLDRCFERIELTRDRDQAEADLRERNLELQTLNIRLQALVEGMQTLATCSTLRDLCEVLVEQLVGLSRAESGRVYLRAGDLGVIRHGTGPSHAGAAGEAGPQLRHALYDTQGERIGEVVVETRRDRPPTQLDRELGQVLVSFANEAFYHLQALERLSWSEARLRAIIDYSPSLISLQDLAGRLLVVNKCFEEWYGLSSEAVVGKTAVELFLPDSTPMYAYQSDAVPKRGQVVDEEIAITFADGTAHSLLMTKFPVLAGNGQSIGLGTIATDVTERRRAEEHLRQAQKMEALGQLTGGVAHDFNNLLAVISGNLSLVEERIEGMDEIAELVEDAFAAAQTGAELTQRLLAFGRRQTLHPQLTDVGEFITEFVRVLERTLGEAVEIQTLLNDDLWLVEVDRSQLETSILNLALNARDAMRQGGVLRIETGNITLDQHGPSAADPKQYVAITVSDTGAGMTADVVERVVQPFFTTKEVGQGSGLGLSMVYGFAEQSGGRLEISSVVGQGTTVKLNLPKARQQARRAGTDRDRSPEASGAGERILVVEDQPNVRRLAKRILTQLGYDVLEAEDGAAALAQLSATLGVDLLFTDIVLPGGMSGIELAATAQTRHPGLRVLFTSGYAPDLVRREHGSHDGLLLVRKPFRKKDIAHMVRQALDVPVG